MLIKKTYKIIILPYAAILLYLMFFGVGRVQMEEHIVRVESIVSTLKFAEKQISYGRFINLIMNILGNVFLFVPFGLLGWRWARYFSLKILIMDFLTAIFIIECLQYLTRMGVFDIDDILLNIFGVYIGFLIMKKINDYNEKNAYLRKK